MAEQVRIEIGFDGGQSLSMLVSPESADELERGIGAGRLGHARRRGRAATSSTCGGSSTCAAFRREARVGFGVGVTRASRR